MRRRAGYTLLEVVLAMAISLLLVAALYIALDVQFRFMQSGRNAVAEGQLARGLLNRVGADVRLGLASLPTKKSSTSTSGAATDSTTAATTTTTSTTTGNGSSSSEATDANAAATPPGQFNMGVQGNESEILLFLTTTPRYSLASAQSQTGMSDFRRVAYQLVPGGGLVRLESRAPADTSMEMAAPEILAPEVVDLKFRYFDAAQGQWLSSWDGSSSGPPQAVEITMAILPPSETAQLGAAPKPPTYYRSVVAVPAAGIPQDVVNQQAEGSP